MLTTAAWRRLAISLGLVGALAGCPGADKDDADASDAPGEDAGHMQGNDSGVRNDGGVRNDAGSDSGIRSDAGADASTDPVAPVLEAATAHQSGRFGDDFRLDVTGTDPDGDAVAVRMTLYNSEGEPIAFADTDGDGKPDVGEAQVPLSAALATTPSAKSFLVVPGLFRKVAVISRAEVALVDAAGLSSDSLEIDVIVQEVLGQDEICDASFVESRCADGFGCKGSAPAVCSPGEAPTIARVVYYADDLGTRVLIEGSDPDLDAQRYRIEFFDGSDQPVMIDTDGDIDAQPDRSDFEGAGNFVWDGNKYFVRLDQGDTFAEMVAKVRVTITDRGGLSSAPSARIPKTVTPTRATGSPCDPRSFDRCGASAVCVAASATSKNYSCTALSSARTKACTTAALLEPAKGVLSVRGDIKDPSLYDAPAGCVGGSDPTRKPEALVKLVLATPASKVTLSTNNLYTSFDSTLYVLSKCDATPVLAWCEDYGFDHESSAAELELTDLAAGTYYVVVDSFNAEFSGTTYQLDVSVE